MATISNHNASVAIPPLPTVAMVPGKPETKMRLSTIVKKEREEQKEQDKKLDNPQKQAQSSTVVNISAKARELDRATPVNQAASAEKTANSTNRAENNPSKNKEIEGTIPATPPQPAINTGSQTTPPKKA